MNDAPDLGGWAARYAAGGLPVLPLHSVRNGHCTCRRPHDCDNPGKHPLTPHGKDDASTDPGQLSEWWGRWPWTNVGARPPAGIVVLDVDPRNGGDAELRRLTAEHATLPNTLTAATGSGGLHIWLAYRGPARGKLCAGVDVKTEHGYLVMPPSLHVCGARYRWVHEVATARPRHGCGACWPRRHRGLPPLP
ncbi:MAG TPA: bifunctional DNA primase/polymerase [Pseudonocardiaceae bacterium]|nr:bifunctional DNA primase/polymerase [Pseudonocardiaceae bacterium]